MRVGQSFSHLFTPFMMAAALLLSGQTAAQSTAEPPAAQPVPLPPTTPVSPVDSPREAADHPDPEGDADNTKLTTEQIEQSLGHELDAQGNWVDSSHEYIGTKADDLAIYLDRFFGSSIEDLESADSTVRFVTRLDYDQDDGSDIKFRVRGNVHLPRISDRVSLVFNGEDDEFDGRDGAEDEDDRNEVGLQLNAGEGRRSRFDFTLSASSGLKLKPGARYRYKYDLVDWGRFRYTGRVDYSDRNLFRHRHSIELDYLTGETSLLRWSNSVEQGQRSEGVEWGTALSWRYGYSIDAAVAFVLRANGNTEPDIPDLVREDPPWVGRAPDQSSLVTNYGAVVRFRNRLYKDWLYVEFEPGYTWRQRNNFEDRHGVFYGRINFEIFFNRGRERQRKKAAEVTEGAGIDPADA